mgnify:CR=1 FL=1
MPPHSGQVDGRLPGIALHASTTERRAEQSGKNYYLVYDPSGRFITRIPSTPSGRSFYQRTIRVLKKNEIARFGATSEDVAAGLKDGTLWLKWPNDIVARDASGDRKLAGVLVERRDAAGEELGRAEVVSRVPLEELPLRELEEALHAHGPPWEPPTPNAPTALRHTCAMSAAADIGRSNGQPVQNRGLEPRVNAPDRNSCG